MVRSLIGGKATSPWRGKITEASSPKRAPSMPGMRGARFQPRWPRRSGLVRASFTQS
jgi:hypothetical protein